MIFGISIDGTDATRANKAFESKNMAESVCEKMNDKALNLGISTKYVVYENPKLQERESVIPAA